MSERKKDHLSQRAQDILGDVVNAYSSSGQPVGSKALAEISRHRLSPASIRNVMAELEDQGYLQSPHTSAGRVPTEKGFRFYATSLVKVGELDKSIKQEIKKQVSGRREVKETLRAVSETLGLFTNCASLVSAPRHDADPLEKIEFIRLKDDRVLAVMVTQGGEVENRIIQVPQTINTSTLNKAAQRLNEVVEGQTLADARVAMMAALSEKKHQVNSMMSQMMTAADTWGEAPITDGALVVAGSQNLFQYPELVREQLRELIQVFEERRLLMALMNEVQKGSGVQIFIGSECPLKVARDCALITANYGSEEGNILGTLGVIGPMRMNYQQSVNVVDYTARLLGRTLGNINKE